MPCDNAHPQCNRCIPWNLECGNERKTKKEWDESTACFTCYQLDRGKFKVTVDDPCVPSMVDGECCPLCTTYALIPDADFKDKNKVERRIIFLTCDKIPGGRSLTTKEMRKLKPKLDREGNRDKRVWNKMLRRYEDQPQKAAKTADEALEEIDLEEVLNVFSTT